jgi:DNA topoisomerase-1
LKKKLVIVESPAKARTLSKILGRSYTLKASVGHVRDLPRSRIGVDIENGFIPKYVVPRAKSKIVTELKKAVKDASIVYLATDPDREGEAISWHLKEVTNPNGTTYRRVVFHEITREAVEYAFKHPRNLDEHLVDAQQARRILDRLVGYKISPLLWKKVRSGLSAGRVQSVALKFICDRELEIIRFVPEEYWSLEAGLRKTAGSERDNIFRAALVGLLDGTKITVDNEEKASRIKDELTGASYRVLKVSTRKVTRQPPPPFITSTLQQEAWRKLRFSARQTMAIAQQLYEGLAIGNEGSVGLITYMRTDSTQVARSAISETRDYIKRKYGDQYLPSHARTFRTVVKGAQEAHEAIRPTEVEREPSRIKQYLNQAQFRLYQLIWQRMVASQMAASEYRNISVDIRASCTDMASDYLLRASSSVLTFPGFTSLYTEGEDEETKKNQRTPALPVLNKGEELLLVELFPEQHFTQPPPRYNEATLVRLLEQQGIGRPSTYAPILSTIQDREYVTKVKGTFQPTEIGTVVSDLLSQHFADIVDAAFTARMEEELDEIAENKRGWAAVVQEFYAPLALSLERAEVIEKVKIADQPVGEDCPECGKPLIMKSGRFGKFVACSGYPDCKYTRSYHVKLGVKCPECATGELIERLSKKKKTFYGCSNYPKCKFITGLRPLPQSCPKCGGLLTRYRGRWAKCIKCGHQMNYKESEAEAPTAKS